MLAKFANFVYFCITLTTKWPTFGEFPPFCGKRNTKVYKICKLCKRIFCIFLQHFATKLGNFTNFDILFLAVARDFDFLAKMKIRFKRGMVHCLKFG